MLFDQIDILLGCFDARRGLLLECAQHVNDLAELHGSMIA
jgi:hypothetical protein